MRTAKLFSMSLLLGAATACAPPPDIGDDGDDVMADGGEGGSSLDESRLDRSASIGSCGYPGPGDNGYGTELGQRLANNDSFVLKTCDGQTLTLADHFCQRDDEYGDFNRGYLINIGAGWCGPCQDETLEFPELYEEFHGQGIEFVQVLFQDWHAQAPTGTFCEDWSTGQWIGEGGDIEDVGIGLPFPVVIDQVGDWTSQYLQDPESATPVNMVVDANGNIRWKIEGQRPDPEVVRTQFELVLANPYGD